MKINNTYIQWINQKLSKKKAIFILIGMYVFAVYAIIDANYNYVDDNGRVAQGYANWGTFSRYISNLLSHIIHGGSYLTDISPVPQILAACIIAVASFSVIWLIKEDKSKIYIWDLIAVLPIGLSPYFLECFSYKYDAPYMALSVLSSLVALLLYQKNTFLYVSAIICSMLVMCMTYQASAGIFPMLVLLMSFLMWCRKEKIKDISIFIIKSAVSYSIGILIFFLFIMKSVNGYIKTGIASFKQILIHYQTYITLVIKDFRKIWLILILILILGCIFSMVIHSKRNKIITFVVSIIVLGIMFLMSFGLYPLLQQPLTAPRAMFGVGVFIALCSIVSIQISQININIIFSSAISWMFFVFSFTYGNALSVQDNYTKFRIEEVINDLTDIESFNTENEKEIQIVGTIGFSPIISNSGYRMLYRLVPITFQESWRWGSYEFYHYYGLKNVSNVNNLQIDPIEYPILQNSAYHTIYGQDEKFIIVLK